MTVYSNPFMMEDILFVALPALVSGIPSAFFGIATYILSSLALYTIAKRRGIRKAWLSWIPVLNVWILGSLSDQYRYVVKGQIRSKRKVLLTLYLVMTGIAVILAGIVIAAAVKFIMGGMGGNGRYVMKIVTGPAITAACLALPMAGVAVAAAVLRYMALCDLYTSLDPANNVLFLVLSIFFPVTEPFFLFFNRNKDLGMPPRKSGTVCEEESL